MLTPTKCAVCIVLGLVAVSLQGCFESADAGPQTTTRSPSMWSSAPDLPSSQGSASSADVAAAEINPQNSQSQEVDSLRLNRAHHQASSQPSHILKQPPSPTPLEQVQQHDQYGCYNELAPSIKFQKDGELKALKGICHRADPDPGLTVQCRKKGTAGIEEIAKAVLAKAVRDCITSAQKHGTSAKEFWKNTKSSIIVLAAEDFAKVEQSAIIHQANDYDVAEAYAPKGWDDRPLEKPDDPSVDIPERPALSQKIPASSQVSRLYSATGRLDLGRSTAPGYSHLTVLVSLLAGGIFLAVVAGYAHSRATSAPSADVEMPVLE
eukprot:gnl/TRDRNA2_/TRDRNA2_92240_c0_seq1.p1 gnl/TRDRNA2_/TRDRNA2_92240_c0~~gnl/TRDRNA2_/TRDRNA2_92240_c0_seq1.p1  ORF type:complete len:322 (+),score=63.20 gnl/TRDRNA2_/TRDRNA2_92240_c0_seq1:41-1006(+)